jgi:predicted O-methyltransferase YrrM
MSQSRYDETRTRSSDIQDHLPYFVDLCITHNIQTVIELGVRGGISTAAWLWGLEQTGGHLYSVDIDPAPYEADNWTFIQGDDLIIADQLPDEADVIFVDTSHTYEQTKAEIELYLPRTRKFMLFHDTDVAEFGVRRALDELCLGWTERPGSNGLGVVTI